MKLNTMVKVSILSTLGLIFTIINIGLPFFPEFLKIDIGNVPAVLGTLILGLNAGIFIELIKNILKFVLNSSTGGIGELANFIVGIFYIIPLYYVYNKFSNFKGYFIGSILGIIGMTISGSVFNYFILMPLYAKLFGGMNVILDMANAINPYIIDLKTLIIYGIAPFNIFKGIIILIVSYITYKPLRDFM